MKIVVGDIETLKGMILFSFLDPETGEWMEYEISPHKNDLYSFCKFMEGISNSNIYIVGFNFIGFDGQVIEYVLRNSQKWYDLSNLEIMDKIYAFSQKVLDDAKFEVWPTFREDEMAFKIIDLFTISHFANKARRCSLKWLEFMMNVPLVEEMPYDHKMEGFTVEQCKEIKSYCRNDVISTYEYYKYIIGETAHPTYKGKNKIQDRLDIIDELKLPARTINFSDVKIGDEYNKMGYSQLTGKNIQELYELKRTRGITKRFTFGDCIPNYVKFTTLEFQSFYNHIKGVKVSLSGKVVKKIPRKGIHKVLKNGEEIKDQEFTFHYKNTTYNIARGGLHSCESSRVIVPTENELLIDADIGSQYPRSIVKRGLFPSHLGKEWLINYNNTIERRIEYKKLSKDPKYKSLSESLKLALNGGGFGKTNENTNWQYDPKVTFSCTIGNQFEILMLIEMLEVADIHVVSANTDGIVCLFHKDLETKYFEICNEWESIVGNDDMGKLEYTYFTKLWQESVNHYIAVKKDETIKIKGRFTIYDELHKNNTDNIERITRLAIQQWVHKGIHPEETVNNCKDIFMFCIGKKAGTDYRWETSDEEGKETQYKRMIRFYISKEGVKIVKVRNEDSMTTGRDMAYYYSGRRVIICNNIDNADIQQVDRDYYIENAINVIKSIQGEHAFINKNQLTLF